MIKQHSPAYRPEVRRHLNNALYSSERAEQQLNDMQYKADWSGDWSVRDPLREATRDTAEIDSSRYGDRALNGVSDLESVQSQLENLSYNAGNSSESTVQSLSNALATARRGGAPKELQTSIEEALEAAQSAENSTDRPSEHVRDLRWNASEVRDGAYEVSLDEEPGEWSGTDVSYYAESALNYLDRSESNLSNTRYDSQTAARDHQSTQTETQEALYLLDAM